MVNILTQHLKKIICCIRSHIIFLNGTKINTALSTLFALQSHFLATSNIGLCYLASKLQNIKLSQKLKLNVIVQISNPFSKEEQQYLKTRQNRKTILWFFSYRLVYNFKNIKNQKLFSAFSNIIYSMLCKDNTK